MIIDAETWLRLNDVSQWDDDEDSDVDETFSGVVERLNEQFPGTHYYWTDDEATGDICVVLRIPTRPIVRQLRQRPASRPPRVRRG